MGAVLSQFMIALFRNFLIGLQEGAPVAPMIPCDTSLVRDSSYPTNVRILIPYPSVFGPANEWFNYIQSSTQILVKQAFGQLKNRF